MSLLDQTLMTMGGGERWTVRHACEGTQIFGATGSGKTSCSGRTIAHGFLRAGFGGVVLTVKPDERRFWESMCAECDRSESLVIVEPGSSLGFNFMHYEYNRPGHGSRDIHNLVRLFTVALESSGRASQGYSDPFWPDALRLIMTNAAHLLDLAGRPISLVEMARVIAEAPTSVQEAKQQDWRTTSFCQMMLDDAYQRVSGGEADVSEHDYDITESYWLNEFPSLASRTRGSVIAMFSAMADQFLRGSFRDLFCGRTSKELLPEITRKGVIILIDLPVKLHGEKGRFAQVLYKLVWQRAMERSAGDDGLRPVFLWADEAQHFLTSEDALFQTTARSARVCTVYLTQNVSNYLATLESHRGKAQADSFLGNMNTKIFHANSDAATNEWASKLFAKQWRMKPTFNSGSGRQEHPGKIFASRSSQEGMSETPSLEPTVPEQEFLTLRTEVGAELITSEAIVAQGGRIWSTSGECFLKTTFSCPLKKERIK